MSDDFFIRLERQLAAAELRELDGYRYLELDGCRYLELNGYRYWITRELYGEGLILNRQPLNTDQLRLDLDFRPPVKRPASHRNRPQRPR